MIQQPHEAFPYVDLPAVQETFVDSVYALHFDGQTLRLILTTVRPDTPSEEKGLTAKQYTAARIVMPVGGALDLMTKMRLLMDKLIRDGQLKPIVQPPQTQGGKPN